MIQRGIGQI